MSGITPLLIKDLLPGWVAILLYVFIGDMFTPVTGFYAALGFSCIFLLFAYLLDRAFPKFILIDTVVFCILGGVSLTTSLDIFIKLKPLVVESLLVVILWFSSYRRKNYFLELSDRYVRGPRILKTSAIKRGPDLIVLLVLLICHTIATLFAALYMSTVWWGLISSIGLFLILVLFLSLRYLHKYRDRMSFRGKEIVPVVDEFGTIIGKKNREDVHFNPSEKFLHPVVHLHVFNSNGELYLQKRPETKSVQPGMWDTAVGGHIGWGETVEESLRRETREEIGLRVFSPVFNGSYIWETDIEKELVFMFTAYTENQPVFNPDEVSDGRFWQLEEIKQNLGKGIFTPNFEREFKDLSPV